MTENSKSCGADALKEGLVGVCQKKKKRKPNMNLSVLPDIKTIIVKKWI